MLSVVFTATISAADVNGRFVITGTQGSKLAVLVQINTSTGTASIGGATIVLGFDTTAAGFKSSPIKDLDYIFHNFCGGNYSPATVSRPMPDRIWINIDLPYNNSGSGTIVAGSADWTDIVTLYLDIEDPQGMTGLYWMTASPFWGIYDADNITLWNTGQFENKVNIPLSNLVDFISGPVEYGLSQNYPNPFNPSTKIQYTIPSVGTSLMKFIQLKVFDVLGNEVSTLIEGYKSPGNYEVSFNAEGLASGIYIYRLIANSFVETKKMILLR